MTSEIASGDGISLHVYRQRGSQSKRARVHLRRADGGPTTVLGLPLLDVLIGPEPSPVETGLLLDCLQQLIDAWEVRNE
jgi:hypothetical protein